VGEEAQGAPTVTRGSAEAPIGGPD
jgi:hypothetical protein